jgi:hypothetical protein
VQATYKGWTTAASSHKWEAYRREQCSPEDKRLRIFPPTTRYSESEKGDNLPHLYDSNCFPMPIAQEQREIVPSEHLQLLLGCLVLGFVLCGSMVVYTNHVKEALNAPAQVPYSGSSAAETTAPLSLRPPGLLEETTSIAQPQSPEVSLKAQPNKPASVTSSRKLHPVHRSSDESGWQTTTFNQRLVQNLIRTASKRGNPNAHPTLAGAWSQTDFPRHAQGALIEMQRQTAKRKNAKEKSSRSRPIQAHAIRTSFGR